MNFQCEFFFTNYLNKQNSILNFIFFINYITKNSIKSRDVIKPYALIFNFQPIVRPTKETFW